MSSFKESLKKTLDKHCMLVKFDGVETIGPNVCYAEIIKLVKGMVPENDIDRDQDGQWCLGFDYCKREFLKNIGDGE